LAFLTLPDRVSLPAANLLQITALSKSYGPVRALDQVTLDVRAGEVHAVVGENGAGKSTLSRIIAGHLPPDAGSILLEGQPYRPRQKRDAEARGVRMILQELNLIGNLTVAESLFVGHLPHRWGWIDYSTLHRQARAALAQVGLEHLNPALPVSRLGVGQQQLVEIAAGLSTASKVLILDEPTAALTDPEIERLFAQLDALRARKTGIIYISHRMNEIRRIADRISVLRDGSLVATRPAETVSTDEIVRLMVGRDPTPQTQPTQREFGDVALRVEGLHRPPQVLNVSFEVRRGEILGFAGLMGSGRTETMRAIFGADRPEGGAVYLRGALEPAVIRSPSDAVRQGLALLTENRKEQGLLLPLSVGENICLPSLERMAAATGWIRQTMEHAAAKRWMEALSVRCRSPRQRVSDLSGGNQQKVVMAKWLLRDSEILIVDEPTRGIDVGARFEVYRILHELAAQGKAIVVVSSDLPELMALADRIAVMSMGRLVATFPRETATENNIMNAALSGHTHGLAS
jgi:ribose transport system ATP-binding protein